MALTRKHKHTDDADDFPRDNKRVRPGSESPAHSERTLESSSTPRTDDDNLNGHDATSANNPPAVSAVTAAPDANNAANVGAANAAPVIAVQPALVTEQDLILTDVERDYIPAHLVPRIIAMCNFSDPAANRYAIGVAPKTLAWGPVGDGTGFDKYLCHNGRPCIFWMPGIATSVWLTPQEGSRVSVGVRLLSDRDQTVARALQYDRCEPRGDPKKAGLTTYASRFLAAKGEEGPSSFEDVFDASQVLEAWSAMDRLPSDHVRKTDVVLVECYVRRFRSRDNNNRYTWNNWAVSFELLRIAHLLSGPGPVEPVAEESNVNL